MKRLRNRASLLASAALALALATQASAQVTPGDRSGTPTSAGSGQSAASATQAPATPKPSSRQAGAGGGADSIGEVIVTARRVEERLQDVPISITVFNQQQLNNRNIVQAGDLATYTPSLSANTSFGSQNTAFAIRGFVQDINTQPSVGVYFADVVEPRAASNNLPAGDGAGPGDFFDLQNVQVLKGPQGTLFGRNTTGGAVLLVPQKPTGKTEGFIEITAGDYDLNRIQAVFNTPIGDKARLRLGVDHEAREGYAINDSGIGPTRFDDIDYTALRGSLVVDLLPNVENYTIASYTRSNTNGDVMKLTGCLPGTGLNFLAANADALGEAACAQLAREQAKGAGFYTLQSAPLANPATTLNITRVINTTTWRATDNLTIKNIASYAQLQEHYLNPIFGTDFDLGDTALHQTLGLPIGTLVDFAFSAPLPNGTAHQSTLTEELQAQGNILNNRLQYQGGVYYEVSDPVNGFSGSQSPVLINCANYQAFICNNPTSGGDVNLTEGRTSFHNLGIYTQGTYAITDQLKLTGGFRYTFDHVKTLGILRSYLFPTGVTQSPTIGFKCNDPSYNNTGCAELITERSSAPTGTVDLDYKPINDLLLYIKYSRGYRAGGVIAQAPAPYQTFQPEHVNTYEAGEKYSFRAPIRGTFDVDGFYNDFSNQQLQAPLVAQVSGLTPATGIINAGQSRIYGVEVETNLNLFQGFTLSASYAYLNTEIESVANIVSQPGASYAVDFPVKAGDPLTLAPENKFTITGTYELPIDRDFGRIAVSATYTHVDRQQDNYLDALPNLTLSIPGIGAVQTVPTPASIQSLAYIAPLDLVNLNLNWTSVFRLPIDLAVFVTNVTDHQYYTFSPGLFQETEFETSQIGEPRMFGVRARYHFGS